MICAVLIGSGFFCLAFAWLLYASEQRLRQQPRHVARYRGQEAGR